MNTRTYLVPSVGKLTLLALTLAAALLATPLPSGAETPEIASPAANPPPLTLSVTPGYAFNSSLNNGGSLSIFQLLVDAGFNTELRKGVGLGLHFTYDYADYHFSGPFGFGGLNPWSKVERLELGSALSYDLTPEWTITVAPSVQISRGDDAGWGNAIGYGGLVSLSKDLSKELTLGLGIGAFSQIEDISVFPMLIVTWQISDRLLLSNPFRPGPATPAGLELSYRIGSGWNAGVGASYRSNRFRLERTGFFGDTVGQVSSLPTWVRLTRNLGSSFSADLYTGLLLGGQLSIDTSNGDRLTSTSADPTPFVSLALSGHF